MIIECLVALAAAGRDDGRVDVDARRASLLAALADELDLHLVGSDGRLTAQAGALLPAADAVLAGMNGFYNNAIRVARTSRPDNVIPLRARSMARTTAEGA